MSAFFRRQQAVQFVQDHGFVGRRQIDHRLAARIDRVADRLNVPVERVRSLRTKYLFLIVQMLHEFGEVFALQGALRDRVPNRCCLFSGYFVVSGPQIKNQIIRI